MTDIFKFWSGLSRGEKIHPADTDVFRRLRPEKHGFQLDCLPGCFGGRLRSAPVVLLYLSPGFSPLDLEDAKSTEGIDYAEKRRSGDEPLRTWGPGLEWVKSRTKVFAEYDVIREKVAFLNIGAYHSKDVKSYASLLALPSSRASLSWAQNVLFPDAEAGRRIVVCMRSAAYWGLDTGAIYGQGLFAPYVTRQGHFIRNDENERLTEIIKTRLANS